MMVDVRNEEEESRPETGDEAIARLLTGNQRFATGRSVHPRIGASRRAELVSGQDPFATILTCSDSRVSPTLLFDQGLGDLFVIQVAGNVISPAVLGSVEFALANLQTPLLLVVGHANCGAVTAALRAPAERSHGTAHVRALVELIQPGLKDLPSSLGWSERLNLAVELNVRWSLKQLAMLPICCQAVRDGQIKLAGGVYELESGQVRMLL